MSQQPTPEQIEVELTQRCYDLMQKNERLRDALQVFCDVLGGMEVMGPSRVASLDPLVEPFRYARALLNP